MFVTADPGPGTLLLLHIWCCSLSLLSTSAPHVSRPSGKTWLFRADIIFHADRWERREECQLVYGTDSVSQKLPRQSCSTLQKLPPWECPAFDINILDKYSVPGVEIMGTKWGSWVDVLFMMVMIINLHKKEISISHYLWTTSMYFSPVPPGLQWNMKSRNISDSYSICENITPNPRPGVKSSYQILMRSGEGLGRRGG